MLRVNKMDISKILDDLGRVSPFEQYRIKVMIQQQLESPKNIQKIKKYLKPNQEITYFDESENRLIEAIVIKLNRTRLLVKNKYDGIKWNIFYYSINVDNLDPIIRGSHAQEGIPKSQLKVGDKVGFPDRQNNEVYGTITKLNQKTVGILADDQTKWRVSYKLLFPVIEVEGSIGGEAKIIELLPPK